LIGLDLGNWVFDVGLVIYLAPLVISIYRQTDNIFWVGLVNVFLGGTVIGWFVALYMAFKRPRHSAFLEKS
jgi:hypothetical protein